MKKSFYYSVILFCSLNIQTTVVSAPCDWLLIGLSVLFSSPPESFDPCDLEKNQYFIRFRSFGNGCYSCSCASAKAIEKSPADLRKLRHIILNTIDQVKKDNLSLDEIRNRIDKIYFFEITECSDKFEEQQYELNQLMDDPIREPLWQRHCTWSCFRNQKDEEKLAAHVKNYILRELPKHQKLVKKELRTIDERVRNTLKYNQTFKKMVDSGYKVSYGGELSFYESIVEQDKALQIKKKQ